MIHIIYTHDNIHARYIALYHDIICIHICSRRRSHNNICITHLVFRTASNAGWYSSCQHCYYQYQYYHQYCYICSPSLQPPRSGGSHSSNTTCIHTQIHMCNYIYIYIYVCISINIYIYIYIYRYAYTCTTHVLFEWRQTSGPARPARERAGLCDVSIARSPLDRAVLKLASAPVAARRQLMHNCFNYHDHHHCHFCLSLVQQQQQQYYQQQ